MVISVGNLSMGGNGKTPMVEYLIRLLKPDYGIAVLSRGYGRSSSGFILVETGHSAADVGDEPLQIFNKFSRSITVAVGESRALAIPKILLEKPEVDVIILDDAFQHRTVVPQVSVLVTDYQIPFFKDYVFPSGMLRESRNGVRRADVVVVTKCPANISLEQRRSYESEIWAYCEKPVFFTTIKYQHPISFADGAPLTHNPPVLLVTGIAKAGRLVEYVSERFELLGHMIFKDHYQYRDKDLEEIKTRYQVHSSKSLIILTTEKDMVRLTAFRKQLQGFPFYYIPIECEFVEGQDRFNNLISNHIESAKDLKSD